MIKYNKLLIEDNKLIIDFELEDKTYYKGCTITGVRVDTPLTYGTDDPYYIEDEDDRSRFTKELPIQGQTKELFIVTPLLYIELPPDIPCGADVVDMAATYDKVSLTKIGLNYLKELGDSCKTPKGFIDFILKQKALDMSILTCNYTEAIKYWKMLTRFPVRTTTNNCGCNGLN